MDDAAVFNEYATDLTTLISSINSKISNDSKTLKGETRRALLRRIEMELEEADEMVEQMAIEVQTADSREKVTLQARLNEFTSTLAKHKTGLKTLSSTADRDELLSSSSSSPDHTSIEMTDSTSFSEIQAQRSRLLSTTDKLSDGQRRLEDSHRVALETEDLGAGILRDLRDQRDTLTHTRDSLFEADGSIDRASNTISKMVRRMYQQRLVTYGIIAILIFLIGYVIFSKLF